MLICLEVKDAVIYYVPVGEISG